MTSLTVAQRNALVKAAKRERENICPIMGVWQASEMAVLAALDRRGLIKWDGGVPRINANGYAAIDA